MEDDRTLGESLKDRQTTRNDPIQVHYRVKTVIWIQLKSSPFNSVDVN